MKGEIPMERRKRTLRLFSLLLAMSSLLVASGVSASQPGYEPAYVNGSTDTVPFKGTFQGHDAVTGLTIATTGTGMGTHLGQFSFTQEVTVNPANLADKGSAHWIAANGDSIDTTVVGSAIPGPVVFTVTEIHTITGGTGRFTGAQGSFTVHRMHVRALSEDGTHVTFGWFEGTITPPGAE
jgi:hypothetical protein